MGPDAGATAGADDPPGPVAASVRPPDLDPSGWSDDDVLAGWDVEPPATAGGGDRPAAWPWLLGLAVLAVSVALGARRWSAAR